MLLEWLMLVVECAGEDEGRGPSPDIARAIALMEATPEQTPSLAALAAAVGLSCSRFKAKFKAVTGHAPRDYLTRLRIERAKALLRDGGETITEIAYGLGFSSSQLFATTFKRYTGTTPSRFRTAPA